MTIPKNIKQALEHIDEAKKQTESYIFNFSGGTRNAMMDIFESQTLALEQLAQAIDALNSQISKP